jgi:hypothetical protein
MSQGRVQRSVDVPAQPYRVNVGQTPPAIQENRCAERTPREGPEFGNGVPVSGDGEGLAPLDSVQHAPPVIAQLSDAHFGHGSVYHR